MGSGNLMSGYGDRTLKFEKSININNAIAWTGISFLDLIPGSNFRFTEETTVNGQKITSVMKTWWESQVYQARANIFYTQPTR
jgi:hypothetical protein